MLNHVIFACCCIRAFTLGLWNAKCKANLAFQAQNCSTSRIELYMYTIAKKFAIVLQCNSTCRIALSHNCKKKKHYFIPFLSHLLWLSHFLNSVLLVYISFRFLPLPFPSLSAICSNGFDMASMGLLWCGCGLLRSVYHGSGGGLAWWAMGYGFWIWVDLGWSRHGSEILDLGSAWRSWVLILCLGSMWIGGDQRSWWWCGSGSMIGSWNMKISVVVGKACSCSWGFGLKWLISMKTMTNPKDEEEEGFC